MNRQPRVSPDKDKVKPDLALQERVKRAIEQANKLKDKQKSKQAISSVPTTVWFGDEWKPKSEYYIRGLALFNRECFAI